MMLTSNIKSLIIHRMCNEAIPPGGGMAAGVSFLRDPEKMLAGWKAAEEWTQSALRAVREAPDPNPWKNATDEAIAGELLRLIEEEKSRMPTPDEAKAGYDLIN